MRRHYAARGITNALGYVIIRIVPIIFLIINKSVKIGKNKLTNMTWRISKSL